MRVWQSNLNIKKQFSVLVFTFVVLCELSKDIKLSDKLSEESCSLPKRIENKDCFYLRFKEEQLLTFLSFTNCIFLTSYAWFKDIGNIILFLSETI